MNELLRRAVFTGANGRVSTVTDNSAGRARLFLGVLALTVAVALLGSGYFAGIRSEASGGNIDAAGGAGSIRMGASTGSSSDVPGRPAAGVLIYGYQANDFAGNLNRLITFMSDAPGTILTDIPITGLNAGESLLGIDFRPSDGFLYSVTTQARVVRLDTATGAATSVGGFVGAMPAFAGVDFDPVADVIRLTGSDDQNLRISPVTGTLLGTDTPLAYAAGDPNAGQNASVSQIAYSGNVATATQTTLYGIDYANNGLRLVRIGGPNGNPAPNAGQVFTVGQFGVFTGNFTGAGFDIQAGTDAAFAVMRVSGQSRLYSIDLATGAATSLGAVRTGTPSIEGIAIRTTPSGGPSPTPTGTPAAQKIAFVSSRSSNSDIWTMNPDGTGAVNVSQNPATDQAAWISQDGSKIIFTSNRDGNFEIYSMNVDGTNQTRLTNNPGFEQGPRFSPDGSRIVFISNRDHPSYEIYSMNADGSNVVRLTNNTAFEGSPSFSPDGSKIVFASTRDSNVGEIYSMSANGTNPVRLTTNTFVDDWPVMSPDGTKILFNSNRTGNSELFVMNADGANPVNLTNSSAVDETGAFSPGGDRIVFTSYRDGNGELYSANADGTNVIRLTNDAGADFYPSWGGQAGPAPTGSISGTVTYGTVPTGQSSRLVPGVTLTAAGSVAANATTNAAGAYSLTGLGAGPYTMTPAKSGDVNASISGLDAARVAQHVAGLITLSPNQQVAGDATNNGSLSGLDAARIAQFAAGLTNPGIAGQWKFQPASRTYQSVTGPLNGENYEAILVGEVTGNWTPPAARAMWNGEDESADLDHERDARPPEDIQRAVSVADDSDPVEVELPGSAKGAAAAGLTIPIYVGDANPGDLVAYDFTVAFDPALLAPTDDAVSTPGTLSDGWTVVTNAETRGEMRVVAFGTSALTGKGNLLNLSFQVADAARATTNLRFAAFRLNEQAATVRASNGRLYLTDVVKAAAGGRLLGN
jgi:Tol biopolymer transport system component